MTREELDEQLSYWNGSTWFLATLVQTFLIAGKVGREAIRELAIERIDDKRFALLDGAMDHQGIDYLPWLREVDCGEHLDFVVRISRHFGGGELHEFFLEAVQKYANDREVALAVINSVSGIPSEVKFQLLRLLIDRWNFDERVISKLSLAFKREEASPEVLEFFGEIWSLHDYPENVMAHFVHAGMRLDSELLAPMWGVVWDRHSGNYEFLLKFARGLIWSDGEGASKWFARCRDSVGTRVREFDWNLLQQYRQRSGSTQHGDDFLDECLEQYGSVPEYLDILVKHAVRQNVHRGIEWLIRLYELSHFDDRVWRMAVKQINLWWDRERELLNQIYLWRQGDERTWIREELKKRIVAYQGVGEEWLVWAEANA
jgi:hypothetical protein